MASAPALDKRGLKRICTSCSTRFYDFNKRPIICPNCETEFTGDVKIRTRRPRGANDDDALPITRLHAEDTPMESIKDVEADEEEAETISLDDAEELEEGEDDVDTESLDADLDLDEDEMDEEEEDDDDEDDTEDEE